MGPGRVAQALDAAEPVSVSEVNAQARALLERQFSSLAVYGEVTGLRVDGSGHRWFALRDRQSALNAVMFRREAAALRWPCAEGSQVIAYGRLTLYAASGRYQMVVQRLVEAGQGALQAAFEQLKKTLQAEGLFAAERKRPLPLLPRRVAVITSRTGAVLRDIVQVATRRMPNCQILVVPVRVQGAECAAEVSAAIATVGRRAARERLDVLIVARGGGSLEDLWGFNDAAVARALAACPIPTVSAVGHETDYTIADFVADVRAPTPSAAAELVFAQKSDLQLSLLQLQGRLLQAVRRQLQRQRLQLRAVRGELGDGRHHAQRQAQRLATCMHRLQQQTRARLGAQQQAFAQLQLRLQRAHPQVSLGRARRQLMQAEAALRAQRRAVLSAAQLRLLPFAPRTLGLPLQRRLRDGRAELAGLAGRLQALSPLAVLSRGYGIVQRSDGSVARDAAQLTPGETLTLRLWAGQVRVRVL